MGDQWKARIAAIENIQEEFGRDIQEIKEQLVRLTSVWGPYQDRGNASSRPITFAKPTGPSTIHPDEKPSARETRRPNLRQPIPIAPSAFMAASWPVDQPSGSKGKPNGQKTNKDRTQWDAIPITYTKLFPKLIEIGHIEPLQLPPLRPSFPRWYNAHTRCDYHAGNPGHITKNCTALKHKFQGLINDRKLKFEDLDRPTQVEDPFRAKVEMARHKHKTPREASLKKAAMPKEKVPIAKIRRSKEGSSTTTDLTSLTFTKYEK